jgi:serine phosphatase RsbU (regulator of sigma subunit)
MQKSQVQTISNDIIETQNQHTIKNSVDALVLTNQDKVFSQIHKLLDEKKLSWIKTSVEDFYITLDTLDFIGTVIVETGGIPQDQREKLCQIIRTIESQDIATILINNHINFPIGNYDLVSVLETGSIEELRGRLAGNISYHKKLTKVDEILEDSHTQEMEEQLKMAGQVQRDFLPAKLPNNKHVKFAAIFQPADWVSGDIFDAQRLDEQHIGFYIADAVGHSMPAAILTMFLKQAMVMRETTGSDYRIYSPAEVLKNLNLKMIEQHLSGSLFATCCYCLLNIRTMQLQYARAGHPYPLLISKNNSIRQLECRGSLLGIFENSQFLQETVQLHEGDRLFMFSDGAESIVGIPQDTGQLVISDDFQSISDLGITRMLEMFDILVRNRTQNNAERDDVTVLGLEILKLE